MFCWRRTPTLLRSAIWFSWLLGIGSVAATLGARAIAMSDPRAGFGLRSFPDVLSTPRDPNAFRDSIELVLPAPVIVRNREDAVARELLNYNKTLNSNDLMRTAQRLTREADAAGFDPLLFVALIYVESYFDHLAVSPVGAEGLMQLMPSTAAWMATREDLGWPEGHSFDPLVNVTLGIAYFDLLYQYFGRLDHALTAYNRGPAATRHILAIRGRLPTGIYDFYAGKVLDRYRILLQRYGQQSNSWVPGTE